MSLSSSEKHYLQLLCAQDTFGFQSLTALYNHYHSFERIYTSNPSEWITSSSQLKDKWLKYKKSLDPDQLDKNLQKNQAHTLSYFDNEYPPLLKEISSPPLMLYYQGDLEVLHTKSLAIVGTRMISSYGQQVIDEFVPQLVAATLTITSGFQRGVDQSAHKAALAAEGKTIAVLGTGLDVDYPSNSNTLRHKIIDSGSIIISEYPFGTVGFKANFPRRNRIVSGLSVGVLVVEAASKSGSIITPHFALEQNREVFAVPGSIFSRHSEGPHELIQQGAKCVHSAQDILSELNIGAPTQPAEPLQLENALQQSIYLKLINEPLTIDQLSVDLDCPVETIGIELTMMEMSGHIRLHADGKYVCQNRR